MSEHVDELLALYALGGLEAEELKAVTDHLAGCDSCRAEADRHEALVAALAASVPARAPDPRLRAVVLSKAGVAARAAAQKARQAARPVRRPLRLAWPGRLATAMAVLMAGLIGWNIYLTSQVVTLQQKVQYNQSALALIAGADTTHMPLQGQGAFAAAAGNAFIDQKTHDVVLVVQRLQLLPANQTYQAWIIADKGPVNAGLFRVSEDGWGMTWLNIPYVQGGVIGVSLEPNGGSPQPTKVVLLSTQ